MKNFLQKTALNLFALLAFSMVETAQAQWLSQFAASYDNRGTIVPTASVQTNSDVYTTSYYRYPLWTLNATAGVTYYFDLCNSSGSALSATRLIIHDGALGMYNTSGATIVIQNVANGCAGAGAGFSKIIWTCQATGTYYLESAASANATFWGVSATQTNILRYYTLPSSSTTCSDIFYDKGNTGTDGSFYNYNNNEDWFYTYYPSTAGNSIRVIFSSFDTQSGSDLLRIYNGNSIAAPQVIGSPFSGTTLPDTITSTALDGSLTFRFTTGNNTISTGWAADISCFSNCSSFPTVSITGSDSICAGDSTMLTANATSSNGPVTSYQWQLNSTNIVGATSNNYAASSAGNYTVFVIDSGGCSSTSSAISVTVNPLPTASFTDSTNLNTVTFTNTSQNGTSYSWDFGDSSPADTSTNPVHTYSASGVYTVTLTVTNGCGNSTSTQQVTVIITGIEIQQNINSLRVFPNPAERLLTVEFKVADRANAVVKIFNSSGQVVFSNEQKHSLVQHRINVDVSSFAKGHYMLQIITDQGMMNKEVIIH